jgi:hypothetical protein
MSPRRAPAPERRCGPRSGPGPKPRAGRALRHAAALLGERSVDLARLAGHDAMNMARLRGISHSPLDASREGDLGRALDLLAASAAELGVAPRAAVVPGAGRR